MQLSPATFPQKVKASVAPNPCGRWAGFIDYYDGHHSSVEGHAHVEARKDDGQACVTDAPLRPRRTIIKGSRYQARPMMSFIAVEQNSQPPFAKRIEAEGGGESPSDYVSATTHIDRSAESRVAPGDFLEIAYGQDRANVSQGVTAQRAEQVRGLHLDYNLSKGNRDDGIDSCWSGRSPGYDYENHSSHRQRDRRRGLTQGRRQRSILGSACTLLPRGVRADFNGALDYFGVLCGGVESRHAGHRQMPQPRMRRSTIRALIQQRIWASELVSRAKLPCRSSARPAKHARVVERERGRSTREVDAGPVKTLGTKEIVILYHFGLRVKGFAFGRFIPERHDRKGGWTYKRHQFQALVTTSILDPWSVSKEARSTVLR